MPASVSPRLAGGCPRPAGGVMAALVLALLLLGPARLWLNRLGRRRAGAGPPRDRFRRTSLALWLVLTAARHTAFSPASSPAPP